MKRTQIINREIEKYGYKSYLEIGVSAGNNFRSVRCSNKVGVDPDPKSKLTTYYMTSNDFFKQNKDKFDIIFIDGLHENNQVQDDISNSLKCLNKNGTIILHDMNPKSEDMQKVPRMSSEWTGDCWKAMYNFRKRFMCLSFTVDTDYGIGVIKPSKQANKQTITEGELTYADFKKNKKEWLGLISVHEYLNEY